MIIGYLSVVISVTVIDVPDALKAATLIWRHFPHISKSMSSPLDRSQYLATSLSLSPAAFFRQPCVCMEVKATSEWESHRDKSALIFPSVLIDLAAQYWPLSLCLSLSAQKKTLCDSVWMMFKQKPRQVLSDVPCCDYPALREAVCTVWTDIWRNPSGHCFWGRTVHEMHERKQQGTLLGGGGYVVNYH